MGIPIIKRFRRILPLFLIYYPLQLSLVFCSCAASYREYQVSLNQDSLRAEELFARGDYAQALDNYEKALSSYENEKNRQGVLLYLEKMGWISQRFPTSFT